MSINTAVFVSNENSFHLPIVIFMTDSWNKNKASVLFEMNFSDSSGIKDQFDKVIK